jgi:hypothetical protein
MSRHIVAISFIGERNWEKINDLLETLTNFVTILTRRVTLVEQELLTLPEHLN